MQAQHPSGGPAGQTTARVTVLNVAPKLSEFRVTDSAGSEVNVDVPFVLTGLPVTVSADFSDPACSTIKPPCSPGAMVRSIPIPLSQRSMRPSVTGRVQ